MSRPMRFRPFLHAVFFSLGATVFGSWASGCSSPEATELVVGVSTQVEVPRNLKTVRLDVLAGTGIIFCQDYEVYNGRVLLPRTLGLTKDQLDAPITVAIYGFLEEKKNIAQDCAAPPKIDDPSIPNNFSPDQKKSAARVLRRSIQPYINGRILYIPMPLRYACFERDCPNPEDTCKAGKCVDANVDPNSLSQYQDGFTNPNGSGCFPLQACMYGAGGTPMTVVNKASCQYRITGGSATNMNLMMAFDEFVVELLDNDKDEGFFFPDPQGQPDLIQLAPGLCEKAPVHKILSVVASTTCKPKGVNQPICNNGDVPLTPATSSVYVLIDPAIGGDSWSKPSAGETKSLKQQIEGALALPSFSNTTVRVEVLPASPPGTPSCNPATLTTEGRITDVYAKVQGLLNLSAGSAHGSIPTALSRVFIAAAGDGFSPAENVKAVVILTNGDPESLQGCGAVGNTAAGFAKALRELKNPDGSSKNIKTYIIPTEKNAPVYPPGAIANILAIATEGGTLQAGDNASNILAKGALYGGLVVSNLSSCKYKRPGHITNEGKTAVVTFVPSDGLTPVVPNLGSGPCSGDGWTVNGEFIDVCGASCERVKVATTAFLGIYSGINDPDSFLAPQSVLWASQAPPK